MNIRPYPTNGMLAGRRFRRLSMFALVVLCAALVGALGFAIVEDHVDRDVLLPGADVYGVAAGGYRMPVAVAMVARDVAMPLLRPLVVEYGGKRWTLQTSRMATVDTKGMVRAAWALGYKDQPWIMRVWHRAASNAVPVRVGLRFRYRDNRVQLFVKKLKADVDRPYVDAAQLVIGKKLIITPSQTARDLKPGIAKTMIREALPKGVRRITPRVIERRPKKTRDDFGKAIVVVKSERTLYLYDKDKLVKTYPVAVGTPGHPTPAGDWRIVSKRKNPTWTNPGSGWAAGMPAYIAPGYNNPLGTRALDLDASGIRIHGTAKDYSVGTAASHGCMRMHMPDIEDLFERVEAGVPVFIRSEA